MRPEEHKESWRERVRARVLVRGLNQKEAARLASRFAQIYVEQGGRRLLDDSVPVTDLDFQVDEGLPTCDFEGLSWVVECSGVQDRARSVEMLARDAAYESALWW